MYSKSGTCGHLVFYCFRWRLGTGEASRPTAEAPSRIMSRLPHYVPQYLPQGLTHTESPLIISLMPDSVLGFQGINVNKTWSLTPKGVESSALSKRSPTCSHVAPSSDAVRSTGSGWERVSRDELPGTSVSDLPLPIGAASGTSYRVSASIFLWLIPANGHSPSAVPVSTRLFFTSALWGRCFYPHCTDEKTEAPKL